MHQRVRRLTYLTLLSDFRDIMLKIKFTFELCNVRIKKREKNNNLFRSNHHRNDEEALYTLIL